MLFYDLAEHYFFQQISTVHLLCIGHYGRPCGHMGERVKVPVFRIFNHHYMHGCRYRGHGDYPMSNTFLMYHEAWFSWRSYCCMLTCLFFSSTENSVQSQLYPGCLDYRLKRNLLRLTLQYDRCMAYCSLQIDASLILCKVGNLFLGKVTTTWNKYYLFTYY